MIVAIHQPNFFPWLGYFNKIARADTFCILDNVQFPKKGGTWINRVQVSQQGRAAWMTAPINRAYHGTQSICETSTCPRSRWRLSILKTLQANYAKAAYFRPALEFLEPLIMEPTDKLAEYNVRAIRAVCAALRLGDTQLILESSCSIAGTGTDLLTGVVRALRGTCYLCGGGADGYQEDEKFATAGIELMYQDFRHPIYPQVKAPAFVPGLSVIDALMNVGVDNTAELVRVQ